MNTSVQLIALTGKAGSGKDRTADEMVRHLGYRHIAFADALRDEIVRAYRINPRILQDREIKELYLPALALGMCGLPEFIKYRVHEFGDDLMLARSPRWVMQHWGDWQRKGNPNHLIDKVISWFRHQVSTGHTRLVVTDLRLINELKQLRSLTDGFRLVRVRRNMSPYHTLHFSHATEKEMQDIQADYEIQNTGELFRLRDLVLQMEKQLFPASTIPEAT